MLHNPLSRSSRHLLGSLQGRADLCHATDGVLLTSSHRADVALAALAGVQGREAAVHHEEDEESVMGELPK